MIRALIVDDERRARAYLAKLVAEHDDIEIVGEARDGASALEAIANLQPDLVFLDVQMPVLTGLDVARALPRESAPLIVFTTAFDQFALDAFEVSATDYLLKPYDGERLDRALTRVRALLKPVADEQGAVDDRLSRLLSALEDRTVPSQPQLSRLPAQGRGRIVLLDLDDISHIASEDRLVFAHTCDARYLLNFSIKDLEQRLPGDRFFRNHRSCIVNLAHVREIVPWFHGKLMLKLDTGVEVAVSEDRAPGLRAAVGLAGGA
ncbi:MAG TPA: LytTR family DNA-binding domain-containing protein [Blastocatellia bacterium]|nr:LytTR family DNA-binding domain-containing protein [Blastocatellia bacterium]